MTPSPTHSVKYESSVIIQNELVVSQPYRDLGRTQSLRSSEDCLFFCLLFTARGGNQDYFHQWYLSGETTFRVLFDQVAAMVHSRVSQSFCSQSGL